MASRTTGATAILRTASSPITIATGNVRAAW
jgi:hypothetical protein